jgi:UDP-N-acetylmuramoyl-tripeptide--D-alanyl-D-alanine ligase
VSYVQDCYNSNPTAMRAAAESFAAERVAGRRLVVCGDMLELGEQAPRLHREVGRHLASCGLDALVAVGPMAAYTLEGWNTAAEGRPGRTFTTAQEAWGTVWKMVRPGDAVLLKGSRGMHLETVLERICEQPESGQRGVA